MFRKALAKYYIKWHNDCCDSVVYCRKKGDEVRAEQYRKQAEHHLTTIMENWEAIEFFSVGDRAFFRDEALPKEFRGYE